MFRSLRFYLPADAVLRRCGAAGLREPLVTICPYLVTLTANRRKRGGGELDDLVWRPVDGFILKKDVIQRPNFLTYRKTRSNLDFDEPA